MRTVVVRVLEKRRITIPKEVADQLGIREGDYLAVRIEDRHIVLEKVDPLDALKGLLAEKSEKGIAEEIDRDRKLSERRET